MYYGLQDKAHTLALAKRVCDALGGGNAAEQLLLETCAAETQLGHYRDPSPMGAGRGCCQIDPIGLLDIQRNSREHFKSVRDNFGYQIALLQIDQVQTDPLLALVLCRLHYKRIPAAIPATRAERAHYWKQYYNTSAGKGTVEHYLKAAELWL